jgi:Protein of unknown function (DUF3592)
MTFARLPWLFGAAFGIPGLIVVVAGGWLIVTQHYRLATYLPVQARTVESRVESHENSKGETTYAPIIAYTYRVQNRIYRSDRIVALGKFSESGSWAWRLTAQYPVRSIATAWYSPQDPSSAFLSREAQGIPHYIALFGSIFLSVGAWATFLFIHGRRLPRLPIQQGDGLFALHEEGTIRARFWFSTFITLAWYLFLMLVIGDYFAVNEYNFDLFSVIATAACSALGLIGVWQCWKWWRLWHDFLDAEVCANSGCFHLGESIQLRLRQGIRRTLQIERLTLGAVCMRSDRTLTGSSITYSPATESRSIWGKLEVNRAYSAGSQLECATTITLPGNADFSSPPRASKYPIFQWSIVLRIVTQGEPELNVHFPIVVEAMT